MPAGSWETDALSGAAADGEWTRCDLQAGLGVTGIRAQGSSSLTGPGRLWLPHLNRDGTLGRREILRQRGGVAGSSEGGW